MGTRGRPIQRSFPRGGKKRPDPAARRQGVVAGSRSAGYTQSRPTESEFPETLPLSQRSPFHGSGAIAFSTKGEYGVRLMVQLGRHLGHGPASLAEIAAAESLPRAYLEQLVMSLRDAGLVVSTRGAHGGYELSRPPEQIRMSEVLRALEGPIVPMICASDDPEHAVLCDRTSVCTVNVLWVRVRDAISGALDAMTLADLVPPRTVPVEELAAHATRSAAPDRAIDSSTSQGAVTVS